MRTTCQNFCGSSLVMQWLPACWMPVRVGDDTVEQRRGKRLKAKGCYWEAVRSTGTQVVKSA